MYLAIVNPSSYCIIFGQAHGYDYNIYCAFIIFTMVGTLYSFGYNNSIWYFKTLH